MKTLLKIFAAAAALGMVPAAAPAQQSPTAPAAATKAAPPADAISAASQAAPAQPSQISAANMGSTQPPADKAVESLASLKPTPAIGQPTEDKGFQPQVTELGQKMLKFHNQILMPLITIISVFVLVLLLIVIVRFRRSANPVPSRTSHNTFIEIVWTLAPVIILVLVAIPSIDLLSQQYSPPKADITVKATGNQWYWTYSYPDNGDFEIVSNVLSDADAKKRGEPRLLAVDERMVVPAGAVVKVITTSTDVIHSWGVPAFWVKMDAVPGRLNETWFKTDRPGVYYGQCFELCGARHGFMPISVEVVSPAQFAAWVKSKGGKMPGEKPAASAPAAAAAPEVTAPGGGTSATPAPTAVSAGTATPPVTNQSQATSSRGN